MSLISAEAAGYTASPPVLASGNVVGGRVRRIRGTITLNSQTTSQTILVGRIPAASHFAYGVLTSSASLGTSTIAIGVAGATGRYRAAATFTAVDTPTLFGPAAAVGSAAGVTAEETIIITIGTASLPASGTLIVDLYVTAS
jgi:hypothetical protein